MAMQSLAWSQCCVQEHLDSESNEAAKKLRDASKVEKDLKHQLVKIKNAAKDLEASYNLVLKAKEVALNKVRD